MRIKLLRNPAAHFLADVEEKERGKMREGQIADVKKELGEKLIKLNIAIDATNLPDEPEQPEVIRAVPQEAAIGPAKVDGFGDNPHKKPEKK